MNDKPDRTPGSPPPTGGSNPEDAVRGLSRPAPDPAFGDRLRRDFADGTITSRLAGVSRLRRRVLLAAAAVVALAAMGAGVVRWNRGPSWVLKGSSGSGAVLVDGEEIALGELGRRIEPGRRIELRGDLQLDLFCPRIFALQATPGTSFTLPASPGRWVGRAVRGAFHAGELRFVTGPGFHGAHLALRAPDADIRITGTTFAVIREPGATCLCVLDGTATMVGRDGSVAEVPAGTRRTVYGSGAPPLVESIRPMERMKLEMLRDQAALAPREGAP